MQQHSNNKWRILMPNNKPRKRNENGKFVSEKAIVSELGVNEKNPVPEKSGDVVTGHGNTIHYS
jgi:hypothetical protein